MKECETVKCRSVAGWGAIGGRVSPPRHPLDIASLLKATTELGPSPWPPRVETRVLIISETAPHLEPLRSSLSKRSTQMYHPANKSG